MNPKGHPKGSAERKRGGMELDRVVFLGRTYMEYRHLFGLDDAVLRRGPVLDCAAGPSSFAAEARGAGFDVTACDVLYDHPVEKLREKGLRDIEMVFAQFDEVEHLYTWQFYENKTGVIRLRRKALDLFCDDFRCSPLSRYQRAALPELPFSDRAFSLVLCSHFLFLYKDKLDVEFHKACLKEMARVSSSEVRIFPLQGLDGKPYPEMAELLNGIDRQGVDVEIATVPFEFQRGSNTMLKLTRL